MKNFRKNIMVFVWFFFGLVLILVLSIVLMFWIKGSQPMRIPEAQKLTYFQLVKDRESAYHENEALYGTADMLKCTPSSRPFQWDVLIIPSKVFWAALRPDSPFSQELDESYRSNIPARLTLLNSVDTWWKTLEEVTWRFTVTRKNLPGSAACTLRPLQQPEETLQVSSVDQAPSGTQDASSQLPVQSKASACTSWSEVSLQDVGRSLCVQGVISKAYLKENAYFLLFGNQPGDFLLLSYDAEFHEAKGKCVQVNGQIQQLGKTPVIVIGAGDLVYCPAE